MNTVPLAAVPSQNIAITLGGQNCLLSIFTLTTGLFFSLALAGTPATPIVNSKICVNTALLVNQGAAGANYSGFVGDFSFVDTQGQTEPVYTGFGNTGRYQLLYFSPGDFA